MEIMKVTEILLFAIFVCNINNALSLNPGNRRAPPRVLVIGGGVAGLTAAARLHNVGFNVTLLEAMDRIGGRTHTLRLDGQYTEMGGEWVHGEKGNSVFELVNPMGLLNTNTSSNSTNRREGGYEFGFQTGEKLNATIGNILWELLEYISSDPEEWEKDLAENVSTGDFARFILNKFRIIYPILSGKVFIEAIYDWAHRVTNSEDGSDNWFETSSTDEGEQFEWLEGYNNITWRPPYSYSSLHQLILTGNVTADGIYDLPEWIKLNTEVTHIEYSNRTNTVNVTTRDGTVFAVEHVIFTPSLGVLKANHMKLFQPQLSRKKRRAIKHIGFGAVTKYALEFETPWWPEGYEGRSLLWNDHNYTNSSLDYWRSNITKEELMEDYDGLPLWTRSILDISTVPSGSAPKVMRVWLTGMPSRFLDEMDPTCIQDTIMAVIHKFLDDTFPNITDPLRTFQSHWASNPFTRGVYSYRTLKSEENNVWARDLAEPILHSSTKQPLLCFAGEATHSTYFSTVHGAYDSGIREFTRIMTWHSNKSQENY